MPRISIIFLLPVAAALLRGEEAAVERSRPQVSFETDVVSRYLWRGVVTNDSPSLQPSVTVAYRGISLNIWNNVSSSVLHNQAWTESDITLEYGRQFGKWAVAGGFTDYHFVDTPAEAGNRSSEIYLGCSWAGPLNPSFRVYRDVELGRGYYYSAAANKSFRLPHGVRAVTTLGVGLNQHQFQRQTTISDIASTTAFDVFTSERVVLTPFFTVMSGHRTLFGTHTAFGLRAVMQR